MDGFEAGPTTPSLEFVFEIAASIGPVSSGGPGPKGERLHIPITGGTVFGPGLSGRIAPGGSDWPLIRPDGVSEISAIYTIIADDGAPILVRNDGLRVSTPDVTSRLRGGEAVDPGEYYFRSRPIFEAPAGRHGWLNDTIFVASVARVAEGVRIKVYAVR